MALQKAYTIRAKNIIQAESSGAVISVTDGDYTVHNAYLRIDRLSARKTFVDLELGVYRSVEAAQDPDARPIYVQTYTFVPDVSDSSLNYHKQGYMYLKTVDEFSGAIDV